MTPPVDGTVPVLPGAELPGVPGVVPGGGGSVEPGGSVPVAWPGGGGSEAEEPEPGGRDPVA